MSTTVNGLGHTYNLPNFVGELFWLTPSDTPLTSMIGGLTGGRRVRSIDFPLGQFVDNVAASQPAIVQGADATFSERDRTQTTNVVQIHQEGFHLAYTKLAAVDNVDLRIEDGEFFSLLGPSGCGKTTTLRLVAGFERPDAGAILIDGVDMAVRDVVALGGTLKKAPSLYPRPGSRGGWTGSRPGCVQRMPRWMRRHRRGR